jgi:hypothetical protein
VPTAEPEQTIIAPHAHLPDPCWKIKPAPGSK